VKAQYANYEKMSSRTSKQIEKELEKLYFFGIFLLFSSVGITLTLMFHNKAIFIVCFLVGAAAGIIAGKLKVYKIKNNLSSVEKIERTEGYTQRFFDEMSKITDDKTYQPSLITAIGYVDCGNPDMVINELKKLTAAFMLKSQPVRICTIRRCLPHIC
ncbi:MAG: hypothetical protein K2G04_06970, partial [Oscillospiraceae bacterium]|nr:hypothetical protein [Oscillospiraceae bacterium]